MVGSSNDQKIYSCFSHLHQVLEFCLQRDLEALRLDKERIATLSLCKHAFGDSLKSSHTLGFLLFLMQRTETSAVEAFPACLLDVEGSFEPVNLTTFSKHYKRERKGNFAVVCDETDMSQRTTQLLRSFCRLARIPCVFMGTNMKIRNFLSERSVSSSNTESIWAYLCTQLPERLANDAEQYVKNQALTYMLQHCRPLFARHLLDAIGIVFPGFLELQPADGSHVVIQDVDGTEFLKILNLVQDQMYISKGSIRTEEGLKGQIKLLADSCRPDSAESFLIHSHFADPVAGSLWLGRAGNAILDLSSSATEAINDVLNAVRDKFDPAPPFEAKQAFAALKDEPVLFAALTSKCDLVGYPFFFEPRRQTRRVSTRSVIRSDQKELLLKKASAFVNDNQRTNSGLWQGSVCTAALVVASHHPDLNVHGFLCNLLMEWSSNVDLNLGRSFGMQISRDFGEGLLVSEFSYFILFSFFGSECKIESCKTESFTVIHIYFLKINCRPRP